MELHNAVRVYGAAAVYGRTLGVRDIRRMNLVQRVVTVTRAFYANGKLTPDDLKLLGWILKVNGKHPD